MDNCVKLHRFEDIYISSINTFNNIYVSVCKIHIFIDIHILIIGGKMNMHIISTLTVVKSN